MESVDCPVEECNGKRFKGNTGLDSHFRQKHKEFPKEISSISSVKSENKYSIKCPVCKTECIQQSGLNEHFRARHRPIINTEMTTSDVACSTNFVDCPLKDCENGLFKNSPELCQHFEIKHKDYPPEENAKSTDKSTKVDGIECPVCGVEYSEQNGLNEHFDGKHLKTVNITHGDKGMCSLAVHQISYSIS